jgi:hypothetical protein
MIIFQREIIKLFFLPNKTNLEDYKKRKELFPNTSITGVRIQAFLKHCLPNGLLFL